MTRDQAVAAIAQAYRLPVRVEMSDAKWDVQSASTMVEALEAVGLLKLEEPRPPSHHVPCLSYLTRGQEHLALCREDTLVETLRQAGYTVTKP